MKYVYSFFLILLLIGITVNGYATKIVSSEYTQDFNYSGQWSELRVELHLISIKNNFTFMDTSYEYPSGKKTLNIQLGRLSDKLKVSVIGVSDVDTINFSVYCESTDSCDDWSVLKNELLAILQQKKD